MQGRFWGVASRGQCPRKTELVPPSGPSFKHFSFSFYLRPAGGSIACDGVALTHKVELEIYNIYHTDVIAVGDV